MLRREFYSGGKIGRSEADFLVVLHKRLQHFFVQAKSLKSAVENQPLT